MIRSLQDNSFIVWSVSKIVDEVMTLMLCILLCFTLSHSFGSPETDYRLSCGMRLNFIPKPVKNYILWGKTNNDWHKDIKIVKVNESDVSSISASAWSGFHLKSKALWQTKWYDNTSLS